MSVHLARVHGGLLGLMIGAFTCAAALLAVRTLHAPVVTGPVAADAVHGPTGFVSGWHRDGDLSWRVVSQRSAHDALVLRVETPDPSRARELAGRLVPFVEDRFGEVLIYIHSAGRASRMAERRIQWTRSGGYDELVLQPPTQ